MERRDGLSAAGDSGHRPLSDLAVEPVSSALLGMTIDVVVSGSIGAVESVRVIRALRRLGAEVVPWLTDGGAQFVTKTALAWAAGRDVRSAFTGDASHIALGDAAVIAPASANFIGEVAAGLTSRPATALVASYLGQGKPVLALATMHGSLGAAPTVRANVARLAEVGVTLLPARAEEGKLKVPEPAPLADVIAHHLNRRRLGQQLGSVLVTMGTTRGPIDDVRYVSNYSTGSLGSKIAEELYRQGLKTVVVAGPSPIRPTVFSQLIEVTTNQEMEAAARGALEAGAEGAVLAASVLDFLPTKAVSGKIASRDHEVLTVELRRTHKIITGLMPRRHDGSLGPKVGFKLEADLDHARASALAHTYIPAYGLSLMVINGLADVSAKAHRATLFTATTQGQVTDLAPGQVLDGKANVAVAVATHVRTALARTQA